MTSRRLTDIEIGLIVSHLDSLRDRTLFILGVKTGFRISELLSLQIKDVMSQKEGCICDTLSVSRARMKGKQRSRTVPIHATAKAQLKEYIDQLNTSDTNTLLFPIDRKWAWRIISRAAKRAGLEGCVSTHSMRKTFGMGVYERTGKNVVAAQRALGHSSLASTTHYLSVDQDEINAAILGD